MDRARTFKRYAMPARAGLAVRPEQWEAVAASAYAVGWYEICAEGCLTADSRQHRDLAAIRERHPLSMHGVGLSIGAPCPLDEDHLRRLKSLVDRYQPALYSEHLAWSTHDSLFFSDRLPIPYDERSVARVSEHIDRVQERLRCRILLENPSTYVMFLDSSMNEIEFLATVAKRTGCGLLLDIGNAQVSAGNQRWDPIAYINCFPMHLVGEIHLAATSGGPEPGGFGPDGRPAIGSSAGHVDPGLWRLYERAIDLAGAVPTLVAWDGRTPAPAGLAQAAEAMDAMLSAARSAEELQFAVAV